VLGVRGQSLRVQVSVPLQAGGGVERVGESWVGVGAEGRKRAGEAPWEGLDFDVEGGAAAGAACGREGGGLKEEPRDADDGLPEDVLETLWAEFGDPPSGIKNMMMI
jgi:hypothetical protein